MRKTRSSMKKDSNQLKLEKFYSTEKADDNLSEDQEDLNKKIKSRTTRSTRANSQQQNNKISQSSQNDKSLSDENTIPSSQESGRKRKRVNIFEKQKKSLKRDDDTNFEPDNGLNNLENLLNEDLEEDTVLSKSNHRKKIKSKRSISKKGVKSSIKSTKSSSQQKTTNVPKSISWQTDSSLYMDDELANLLLESEKSNRLLNEYKNYAVSNMESINREKERLDLEKKRKNIEASEKRKKDQLQSLENYDSKYNITPTSSQETRILDLESESNTSNLSKKYLFTQNELESNNDSDFSNEILYRSIFLHNPNTISEDILKSYLSYDGVRMMHSETILLLRGLTHLLGATQDEIRWLLRNAMPPLIVEENSTICSHIYTESSEAALNSLTNPLTLRSKSILEFNELEKIIEEFLGIQLSDIYQLFRLETNSSNKTKNDRSQNRFTIGNVIDSNIKDQLDDDIFDKFSLILTVHQIERVCRLFRILPYIIYYHHYDAKDTNVIFYLVCYGASLGDGELDILTEKCFIELDKLHNNPDHPWTLPSPEEFISTFPFIRNKYLEVWVVKILHAFIITKTPTLALFASQCAQKYSYSIINSSTFILESKNSINVSNFGNWIVSVLLWVRKLHEHLIRSIDFGTQEDIDYIGIHCNDLYWILQFFVISVFNGEAYKDSLKDRLHYDEVSAQSNFIESTLQSIRSTGNLHVGESSVSRYSLFVSNIVDLWEYYFRPFFSDRDLILSRALF